MANFAAELVKGRGHQFDTGCGLDMSIRGVDIYRVALATVLGILFFLSFFAGIRKITRCFASRKTVRKPPRTLVTEILL